MKGLFITVEGVDGSGKSTGLIRVLSELKKRTHKEVLLTREPGGTPLAEQLRELVLSAKHETDMHDMTELLLMFASRSDHLKSLIIPALHQGIHVTCDRFTHSTYAYQCGGRGLDESYVKSLEDMVQGGVKPDITIYFDCPAEIGLARIAQNGGEKDRIEQAGIDFHHRVRNKYLQMANDEADRFYVIDASQSIDDVAAQIDRTIKEIANLYPL